MSDENRTETETETETASETPETGAAKGAPSTAVAPPSVLTRDSDRVARPGFRNPPNSKSKAMKKR